MSAPPNLDIPAGLGGAPAAAARSPLPLSPSGPLLAGAPSHRTHPLPSGPDGAALAPGLATPARVLPKCSMCGADAAFMCSSCNAGAKATYCSVGCQTKDWPRHAKECHVAPRTGPPLPGSTSEHQLADLSRDGAARPPPGAPVGIIANLEVDPNDLRFYMQQIFEITKPVIACILLSVFFVKVTMARNNAVTVQSSYSLIQPAGGSGDSGSADAINGLVQALVIIGNVIVATVVIVLLFKYNQMKIIFGFFGLTVMLLLGYFSYFLWTKLFTVWNLPIDWLTMIFCLWNFTVVGMMCIFWRGPPKVTQFYLVIMSSLMAYTLTGLQDWTTWILLSLLVIWDLVAVLCPYGPLRLLIEHVKSKPESTAPLNALLYTAAVWTMIAPEDFMFPEKSPLQLSRSAVPLPVHANKSPPPLAKTPSLDDEPILLTDKLLVPGGGLIQNRHRRMNDSGLELTGAAEPRKVPGDVPGNAAADGPPLSTSTPPAGAPPPNSGPELHDAAGMPLPPTFVPVTNQSHGPPTPTGPAPPTASGGAPPAGPDEGDEDEEEERSGLKLGLGDFVFYSVLISRAAVFDWITTLACVIAVLSGLNATIFLLAIARKALPALPISLTIGIVFYFVTRLVVTPYFGTSGLIEFSGPSGGPGLGVGKAVAGMIVI